MKKRVIPLKLIQDSAEMADLTFKVCKATCARLGMCCDEMSCSVTRMTLTDMGYEKDFVWKAEQKAPYFDMEANKCSLPPHMRLLCTVHQCDILNDGFFKDPEVDKRYWDLRSDMDDEFFSMMQRSED